MKIKISILTIFFVLISTYSKSGTIKLFISNIDDKKGTIHYAIYNNPELFPKERGKILGGYETVTEVMKNGLIIKGLNESVYAIAIYHDINLNKKFDTFLSMPLEKYGFSNNAKVFLGPPKFDEASFFLGDDDIVELVIDLK